MGVTKVASFVSEFIDDFGQKMPFTFTTKIRNRVNTRAPVALAPLQRC